MKHHRLSLICITVLSAITPKAWAVNYECLTPYLDPTDITFNCTGAGDLTLAYPKINVENGSSVNDTNITFNASQVTIQGSRLDPVNALFYNSTITFTKQASLNIGSHGVLSLGYHTHLIFSNSTLFVDGSITTSAASTKSSITLQNGATLNWENNVPINTSISWQLQGPVTIHRHANSQEQVFTDNLIKAFNSETTIQFEGDGRILTPALQNIRQLDVRPRTTLQVNALPQKTSLIFDDEYGAENVLIYSGTSATEVENINLPTFPARFPDQLDASQLHIAGNLRSIDLSLISGRNSILGLLNSDTHYIEFSHTNWTRIFTNPHDSTHPPHIQYDGHTLDWMPLTGLYSADTDSRPSLQLNNELPPLDLSLLNGGRFATEAASINEPNYNVMGYRLTAHGKIILNANQTITQLSPDYTVEVLPGKVITWAAPELKSLTAQTHDQQPVLTGSGGVIRLTAEAPHWTTDAFSSLDPQGMIIVFGNANTAENVHTTESLPARFGVASNTKILYNSNSLSGKRPINADFIEGTVQLQSAIDFAKATIFPHPWHIARGNGSIVLNTSQFSHPESLLGKSVVIAQAPDTFNVVLEGNKTVQMQGKDYEYHINKTADTGAMFNYSLVLVDPSTQPQPGSGSPGGSGNPGGSGSHGGSGNPGGSGSHGGSGNPSGSAGGQGGAAGGAGGQGGSAGGAGSPGSSGSPGANPGMGGNGNGSSIPTIITQTLMALSQPATEVRIRMDAVRLNRDLWHPDRLNRYGTYAWAKFVSTYQSMDPIDTPQADYDQSVYAAGINLGAEYQRPSWRKGEELAFSFVTEWLAGTRHVGDTDYAEQRFNTGIGGRWQKDRIYGALSAKWLYVHQSGHNVNRGQSAVELSAETGMRLHLRPGMDITPFTQYSWTHFDGEYASSSYAQQHLQLGAILSIPYADSQVALRNNIGLSTIISLLSNDKASFQAYYNLRLGGERLGQYVNDHFGLLFQTTLEYAPSDSRFGFDVTLGADYMF